MIRDINHNEISEVDAQKIVILLHEQGVINNKGEFDSKILFGDFKEGFTYVSQRKILVTSIKSGLVKNKINSINDINLGEDYNKHKPRIIELCKKTHNQLTTDHKFSRNKLYQEISEELLGSILNTFNDYMIRPTTNRFIEQQIGNISGMIQEHFNGITFAEEASQYRSKYQISLNVNNIGNDTIDEKIEHLPEEKKELVREKIKAQKGDITDLGSIASKLERPIAIYKNGELYDIIGDSNQGEPIRLDYDPKNGGHWSPHDVKNFENQELNNCLFEAVAYQSGSDIDSLDLKVYSALDKIENTEKYKDIKLYYNHLASYGNPELLMTGGQNIGWITEESAYNSLDQSFKNKAYKAFNDKAKELLKEPDISKRKKEAEKYIEEFEQKNVRVNGETGYGGMHEILPTDVVKDLFIRSCGLVNGVTPTFTFQGKEYNWIDVQNALRTPTALVIFRGTESNGLVEGAGHSSGNVEFLKGRETQAKFHDGLREIIKRSGNPQDALAATIEYQLNNTVSAKNNPSQYVKTGFDKKPLDDNGRQAYNTSVAASRNDLKRQLLQLNLAKIQDDSKLIITKNGGRISPIDRGTPRSNPSKLSMIDAPNTYINRNTYFSPK